MVHDPTRVICYVKADGLIVKRLHKRDLTPAEWERVRQLADRLGVTERTAWTNHVQPQWEVQRAKAARLRLIVGGRGH